MEEPFLEQVQKMLPHMMHSEIIGHRKLIRIAEGNESKRRNTEGENAEARKEEANNESEEDEGNNGDEEGKEEFGILTARARANYKKDCKRQKVNKL